LHAEEDVREDSHELGVSAGLKNLFTPSR
jgi:hypothetical protein